MPSSSDIAEAILAVAAVCGSKRSLPSYDVLEAAKARERVARAKFAVTGAAEQAAEHKRKLEVKVFQAAERKRKLEAAAKRKAEREAEREAKQEAAAKRKAEREAKQEAAAKRKAEREAEQEAAAKRKAEREAAEREAEQEAAAKRKEAEREAKQESAASRKEAEREAKQEAAASRKAEHEANRKTEQEAAAKRKAKVLASLSTPADENELLPSEVDQLWSKQFQDNSSPISDLDQVSTLWSNSTHKRLPGFGEAASTCFNNGWKQCDIIHAILIRTYPWVYKHACELRCLYKHVLYHRVHGAVFYDVRTKDRLFAIQRDNSRCIPTLDECLKLCSSFLSKTIDANPMENARYAMECWSLNNYHYEVDLNDDVDVSEEYGMIPM